MKLSLCAITGNCEDLMPRFLDTFQPLFDECIIVRACGNQTPDSSLDIARQRGCIVDEYINKQDWPHVDDFAAARNVAWSKATGDWVAWADIDDLIQGGDFIRTYLQSLDEKVWLVQCPYDIPDQGINNNFRERFVRRGKFEWHQPIHECLKPVTDEPYSYVSTEEIRWIHRPTRARETSSERNLRILDSIPEERQTASTLFYQFTELSALGRKGEALQAAQKFLSKPEAGEAEKYEVLLQLGATADDPSMTSKLLHQAYEVSPNRPEALNELANLELTLGDPQLALSYITQAMAQPEPKEKKWNLRAPFLGFMRHQLYIEALRMTGSALKAHVLERNTLRENGCDISLLHATRGRPLQAARARKLWFNRANQPEKIEHIFSVDVDDTTARPLYRYRTVANTGNGGCVEAWNAAAKESIGQILVQLSDDWVPPWGWDDIIRKSLDVTKPQVLAVSDGHRTDQLLCMAILTRVRYLQQGYLFHPDFVSMYSDNWFTHCAYRDGVVVEKRDVIFEHNHPAFGKAEVDQTYANQNSKAAYKYGEAVFERLMEG